MYPGKESSRLVCVTQRMACQGDFLKRLEAILSCRPAGLVLREKDLSLSEYLELAARVQALCSFYEIPLALTALGDNAWLHPDFLAFLSAYGCGIQLPFALRKQGEEQNLTFGLSVHSREEAALSADSQAFALIAGHIYPTACKPGLPPKGPDFLRETVNAAQKPVFAIGGITPQRVPEILETGAAGYCVMNPLMTCPDPILLMEAYRLQEEGRAGTERK